MAFPLLTPRPRPFRLVLTRLVLGLAAVLGTAGCRNESPTPAPAPAVAGFDVLGTAAPDVITVGTYDAIKVTNTSANAASYRWTLGNDSTKTGRDPGLLSYPRAGTYTLTLTAQNAAGQTAAVSRQVRVLDRVLKHIILYGARFENTLSPHAFPDPTVYAVLRLGPNGQVYPVPADPYASYPAPILYQGPLLPHFTGAGLPLTLDVPGRLVIDYPALSTHFTTNLGYTGVGYGLELYVQDATGTYLASSSYQALYRSQAGNIRIMADIARNQFEAQYSNVALVCDYE